MTQSLDIQTVIREGKRIRTAYLDVRVLASPLAHPRVGIVVPKHSRSAVDRNRVKRRLRELVRLELLPTLRAQAPCDVLFRARDETYTAQFADLREAIRSLAVRLATPKAIDETRDPG